MNRDLFQKASQGCKLDKPFTTYMIFKQPWKKQLQSLLLPHIVFSNLYNCYPESWKKVVLPDHGGELLETFWANQKKGHPAFKGHPIVAKKGFVAKKAIPISLHGDGTPAVAVGKIWAKYLTTFSWTSMVSQGALTKDSQFPIWFLWDETDAQCSDEFFSILSWSLNALQSGLWPSCDHHGKQLLGEYWCFFLAELCVLCFLLCFVFVADFGPAFQV